MRKTRRYTFGTKSKQYLYNPQIKDEVRTLCKMALEFSTIDFSIIDGFRSAKEQNELYKKGKTELDGFQLLSPHQSGLAVDVFPYVPTLDCWDVANPQVAFVWLEIYRAFLRAARILNLNLELGVSYNIGNGRDYPHIQINK